MPAPVLPKHPRVVLTNIWDLHAKSYWVCIPVNIGWDKNDCNVMGRGLAREASHRYPELDKWYGRLCRKFKDNVDICIYNPGKLLMVPTKPLNEEKPWLSWQSNSSLKLIARSLRQLVACASQENLHKIAVPYLGCGNGGLAPIVVFPLLNSILTDRFTIVKYPRS